MVIDSYEMNAQSSYSYMKVESVSFSRSQTSTAAAPAAAQQEETAEISDKAKELADASKKAREQFVGQAKVWSPSKLKQSWIPKDANELRMSLLEMFIKAMTGKKYSLKQVEMPQNSSAQSQVSLEGLNIQSSGAAAQTRGVSDTYTFESFSYESERVSYSAQGVVKTADGKTINIDIGFSMSRQVAAYANTSISVAVKDPLVINYSGTAASLTNEKFAFDLTLDGVDDMISFAGEGSGFLALDKNGDGAINDGSELFGPSSGSGFDELRQYDQDGNGWIDEADDVFSKLLVWSKDSDGNDVFYRLQDLGIGAIYLGAVDTQFSMNGTDGSTNGVMRSSSVFLREDGSAGTISHIDLTL